MKDRERGEEKREGRRLKERKSNSRRKGWKSTDYGMDTVQNIRITKKQIQGKTKGSVE